MSSLIKYYIKLRNLYNYILISFLVIYIKLLKSDTHSNNLLIVRLDEIGDFVLFQNFIELIRNSDKYQNYRISLCGNLVWRDLAEVTLQNAVDHFIWVDKKKFEKSLRYKYQLLKKIYSEGYSVVINPHYTRGILYDDSIVRSSKAPVKVGSEGSSESHTNWKRHL